MIKHDRDLPVKRQAKLPDTSRSSVYYRPRPVRATSMVGARDPIKLLRSIPGGTATENTPTSDQQIEFLGLKFIGVPFETYYVAHLHLYRNVGIESSLRG